MLKSHHWQLKATLRYEAVMRGSISPRSAIKGSNLDISSSSGIKYVGNGSVEMSGFLQKASFI